MYVEIHMYAICFPLMRIMRATYVRLVWVCAYECVFVYTHTQINENLLFFMIGKNVSGKNGFKLNGSLCIYRMTQNIASS